MISRLQPLHAQPALFPFSHCKNGPQLSLTLSWPEPYACTRLCSFTDSTAP